MIPATRIILIAFLLLQFNHIYAQKAGPDNFYEQIKNYDLSVVLNADSILTEDGEGGLDKLKRPEPLGFIGEDFQRFYIHILSLQQHPENHYKYRVSGKTMVKATVHSFQGTIKVIQAFTYPKTDTLKCFRKGTVICEVNLFENKTQSASGHIKGKWTANFIIDNKNTIRYDASHANADRFNNNQFIGNWIDYKTNVSRKCNWGDYRIPDCGDLDIGAGQFSVDTKYVEKDWLSYMIENAAPSCFIIVNGASTPKNIKHWWE